MTLEERIKQMLEEANKTVAEETTTIVAETTTTTETVEQPTENIVENKDNKVSSQVSALLEAEGLSEDFKLQAVTIFEAAVADRTMQIQEQLQEEFETKLQEAQAELADHIDGYLTEIAQEWAANNEVAIRANFKTKLAESFIDGLQALLSEHNIDLPEDQENALELALEQVTELEDAVAAEKAKQTSLQEEINALKATAIMESFKDKMAATEFDRFKQLTESVKFTNETQYAKQLNIVLENFGKLAKEFTKETTQIVEDVQEVATTKIVTESNDSVNFYADFIKSSRI
jgi:hypothetical protein